jgi:tetratricopeptide (TPR) repeat protein
VLNVIGFNYLQLWGHAHAVIELREQLVGKLTDRYLEYVNLGNLGIVYDDTGQVRIAISFYEQALKIAREDNNRHGIGASLGNLGSAYAQLGETYRAIEHYEQALAISREIGGRLGEGAELGGLGNAYSQLGETHRSLEYYEQALAISRETGDRIGEGRSLSNLGYAVSQVGDFEQSVCYYNDALKIGRDISHKSGTSHRLEGLGLAYHHLGDLAEAHRCYEEALDLDIPSTNYSCVISLGIISLEENKAAEAEDHFTRGMALCRALLEKTPGLYEALYELALAQLGSGRSDEAMATYRKALEVCSAKGVVQDVLQDLQLLQRAAWATAGLADVQAILEEALKKD